MYILSLKLFFNSLNCQANKLLDKVGPNSENPPAMLIMYILSLLFFNSLNCQANKLLDKVSVSPTVTFFPSILRSLSPPPFPFPLLSLSSSSFSLSPFPLSCHLVVLRAFRRWKGNTMESKRMVRLVDYYIEI